jgi:hypothetical protein
VGAPCKKLKTEVNVDDEDGTNAKSEGELKRPPSRKPKIKMDKDDENGVNVKSEDELKKPSFKKPKLEKGNDDDGNGICTRQLPVPTFGHIKH